MGCSRFSKRIIPGAGLRHVRTGARTARNAFRGARLPGDAQQNADAHEHGEQIGAAITDEGQRETFIWESAGDHSDIDKRLEADQKGNAATEQQAERIARIQSDAYPAHDDGDKGNDDQQSRNQAEFLADYRKNEVRVVLGNESQFLTAIAQATPGPTAGAERHHGFVGLVTDPGLAIFW